MRGYAFFPTAMLPLLILGLVQALRRKSSSPYRVLLLAALAAPVGAAMAGLGVTRVLAFVVPATALAGLGLEAIAARVGPALARRAAGIGLAAGLSFAGFSLLADALEHGPTWYDDYGLYGLQYGARQVFSEIRSVLTEDPEARIVLSPVWANGTDILLRYFLPDDPRVRLEGGISLLEGPNDDLDDTTYVLTPEEFEVVRVSPLFGEVHELKALPYPDGRPGFFFLALRYAPDAERQFAQQLAERRLPVVGQVQLDGQWIMVEHSPFDIGDLPEIFDRDPFTVARTRESNPAVLTLTFPTSRPLSGLSLSVSSMDLTLRASLRTAGGDKPETFVWNFTDLPVDPTVEVQFWETPRPIEVMTLEIENRALQALDKVHIIDLILR
jgi:hypothetical protein